MLVAHARTAKNDDLLLLGLSAANRARLALGLPIDLNLTGRHGPLRIVIFGGESEDEMQGELFSLITDETRVTKLEVP